MQIHNDLNDRNAEPSAGKPQSVGKIALGRLLRLFWATAFLLPALGGHGGVIFTNIFSFDGTNGGGPETSLMQGSDGCFYGTTDGGGTYGFGTVFKMNTNGVLTTLYNFGQITNSDYTYGPLDGADPFCTLAQGSDGNFYGTTAFGGTNNGGTVFEITTNGSFITLYSFTYNADGGDPKAGLTQGSDGDLYGVTDQGGTNGYGTAFKIGTNGTFTVLHDFTNHDDGGSPYTASLVLGSDGNLYGATVEGGNFGVGTLFEITPGGILTTFVTVTNGFVGGTTGENPKAGLVLGRDGNFYGTTQSGGTNLDFGVGTVFRVTTNEDLTTLAYFNGANGGAPMAPLIQGADGNFYGTTSQGGTNGFGTAFRITPSGMLTSLYSFTNPAGYLSDFFGGLVQGRDGSFYGVLPFGGVNGAGTVYRLTITATATPSFQSISQTNGILSLTWSTEAGATYQVQYNCDLSSTNWTNLGGAITAVGATSSATDSITNGPQRFYRIALLP